MKAIYLSPIVEVNVVATGTMMTQQVSGPSGMTYGGQADPGTHPRVRRVEVF